MTINSAEEVIRWLYDQQHAALIQWGDDGLTRDRPYITRGADLVVKDCPVPWPWHVVGSDDPDVLDCGTQTLVLDYDLDVYDVWPGCPCADPIGSWPARQDQPLDVVALRAVAELRSLPGSMLVLSGGWVPRTISLALGNWAATYAARPDLRFRWNPAEQSPIVRTFRQYLPQLEERHRSESRWVTLGWAPDLSYPKDVLDPERVEVRDARRTLRIAEARRWARRMTIDPALAWLTPAEASSLVDLDAAQDVTAWAIRHGIRAAAGPGIEPMLPAVPVLALAES